MQQAKPPQFEHANKPKLVWGLICLLGPTALIILSILLYATFNFIASITTSDAVLATGPTPIWTTIANVVVFVGGALGVIAWIPGLMFGIFLLLTRK